MIVMGIDQSYTKTGIVIMESGNPEMLHYEKMTSDKTQDYFTRAYDLAGRIQKVAAEHNIDVVCIEGLAFAARGDQTRNLGGLQFMIVNSLRHNLINNTVKTPTVHIVAPTTLKKHATGCGGKKTKKADMINALDPKIKEIFWEKMGLRKTTGLDDMADAYWLATYGMTL